MTSSPDMSDDPPLPIPGHAAWTHMHGSTTVEPRADVVETYWLFSEAWAALTKPGAKLSRAAALLSAVLFKKDAYFDVSDPLPFLGALFVHLPTLLARNVRNGNKWAKIDPCIGKMTEENGD